MKPGSDSIRLTLGGHVAQTPVAQLAEQLAAIPVGALPLQAGCVQGGWADTDHVELTLLATAPDNGGLIVTATAYYEEVVGGCNCSEDPVRYPAVLRLRLTVADDGLVTTIEPLAE